MTRLSLRWRLVAWCAVWLLVALALAGALALREARRDMARELGAAHASARALAVATTASLLSSMSGPAAMRALPEALPPLRHVRISVLDAAFGAAPGPRAPVPDRPAPGWFAGLATPPPVVTRLPVATGGRLHGWLLIATDPRNQIADAWARMRGAGGIALGAFAAMMLTVHLVARRALRPLTALGDTLAALNRGDLTRRAPRVAGPDLGPLAIRIDRLAEGLERAAAERRAMDRKMVAIQDEERKVLARELHDELGPSLFGLGVEAAALEKAAPHAAPRVETMRRIIAHLQAVNRRMLTALRPTAVGQLPLPEVLEDLVAGFRDMAPDVTWILSLPDDLPEPEEAVALTLYRAVQEGITNALRHGAPGAVRIALTHGDGLTLTIEDDGEGRADNAAEGRGILGMRERARALGGTLTIGPGAAGGLRLILRLPARPEPAP